MISSVTTTVSTIVSSSSATGIGIALGVAAIITLICGLVIRELSTGQKTSFGIIGRNIQIAILLLRKDFPDFCANDSNKHKKQR